MARKSTRKLKSIEELIKVNKEMLLDEARAVSKRVSQQSWRIRKQYNKYSGALMNLIDRGGIHINKNMTRNELLREIKKGLDFLSSETSTIRGITRVEKRIEKGLKAQNVDIEDFNAYQKKRFFRAFDKLAKTHPEVGNKQYKYEVMEKLSNLQSVNKRRGVDWLVDQMEASLDQIISEKSSNLFPEDVFSANI